MILFALISVSGFSQTIKKESESFNNKNICRNPYLQDTIYVIKSKTEKLNDMKISTDSLNKKMDYIIIKLKSEKKK